MSRSSSPPEAPSEAIRHVCPENGSAACRASRRSSLTDIRGMRIKHMTTASVMAVTMDTFTVPRRTPKYAFATTTIESRIQTRLEKSSKTIFYAMGQQSRNPRHESIYCRDYLFLILAAAAGHRSRLLSLLYGHHKLPQGRLSSERA
jgi:hypothetical protein